MRALKSPDVLKSLDILKFSDPLKPQGMNQSWFRKLTIGIAFFFTLLLFLSVGVLLFVLTPSEILSALLSEEMFYSMKLSVLTSFASTFSVMCCSIPTAYALSRFSFPGKSLIKAVLGLPMAFPELVMGLALLLLFGHGFLGPYLEAAGIKVTFTKLGIVVAQFFVAFPYAVRVIYSTFEDINPRYEQVSRSFGYGEFETFRHVTLPMARSGLFASSVIYLCPLHWGFRGRARACRRFLHAHRSPARDPLPEHLLRKPGNGSDKRDFAYGDCFSCNPQL